MSRDGSAAAWIQPWIIFGRDEDSDASDGPWWPLYRSFPPIRAKSAANAIAQVRERLDGEPQWVEFAAIPFDAWETEMVE